MFSRLQSGYRLRQGSGKDKALLLKFMYWTYQELFPGQPDFSHLAKTVEQYFSQETPLWLIEVATSQSQAPPDLTAIACLWMGNAIDQVTGDRYAHVFLVYVTPEHRRRGIATALLHQAQQWAKARGDRQIGLHVFHQNQPALTLYHHLGFQPLSQLMVKSLRRECGETRGRGDTETRGWGE